MADLTGTISTTHAPTDVQSTALSNSENRRIYPQSIDRNLLRKPDGYVVIFSVARRDFVSCHPLVRAGVHALHADAPKGSYTVVAVLPDPFQEPITDHNGKTKAEATEARRVAQDYCYAANNTLDQDFRVPEKLRLGVGTNLTEQGVFWVEANRCTTKIVRNAKNESHTEYVPPAEEVAKAEQRLEKYYQRLLDEARALELTDPKVLEQALNQDYRLAADYFGVETTWHKKLVYRAECPNCGLNIKPGLKFHREQNGNLCIVGADGWLAAYEAGAVKKADIPKRFQSAVLGDDEAAK